MANERETLLVKTENGIRTILFNRPKRRNGLTRLMYEEMTDIINKSSENESVRMLVFTGVGNFFSSGNDFSSFMENASHKEDQTICFKNFIDTLITFPKLLVAIVNGPAIGVATTILGLFDIVYASEEAYFLTPFVNLGICSEGCSSYTFPRIMGSKAGEMLYLGHKMNAMEAKECGFVSEVYKNNQLNNIWNRLNKVSSLSLQSIHAIKRLVKRWNEKILLEVNEAEVKTLRELLESPEVLERVVMLFQKKSKL